jgi:hypothetical protein
MLVKAAEKTPNSCTFFSVDRRLQEKEKFRGIWLGIGRTRSVRNVRMEGQILEVAERQPAISTRHLSACTSTPMLK